MTPAGFRKLALSFAGVAECPHMDRAAFRTKRKIFATLGGDGRVNLIVQPEERREALLASFPGTFASLGGWSRLGFVAVDLASVDEAIVRELVEDAWREAQPTARRPRAKPGRRTFP